MDTERRRIERDLHDGVQQRLVALAMLLGRARRSRERDPRQADTLATCSRTGWRRWRSSSRRWSGSGRAGP
ncbi:histidine kinase [Streptomyces sp. NRRL S-378]|uniref:histidine kinase n=1 Tax=Streptomyces sp. NRRL S-378 TaxID=1463904 RepID=UPI003B635FC8